VGRQTLSETTYAAMWSTRWATRESHRVIARPDQGPVRADQPLPPGSCNPSAHIYITNPGCRTKLVVLYPPLLRVATV
jgi:hypothetical protein